MTNETFLDAVKQFCDLVEADNCDKVWHYGKSLDIADLRKLLSPPSRPQGEEGLASAFIDHRGNELRCSTAVYQEIRWLRDQAGLERAPVEMLVDADWLRRRAEADPDEECEARPALSNQGKPSS
jgi:hypothetical protein